MNSRYADLKDASVFVTGGGSGIGAAIVEGFLRQGARVSFVCRSDAGPFVDEVAQRTGNRPRFESCDITRTAALQAALGRAAAAQGPIRILVNNAANDQRHDTASLTEAEWDALIAINLKAHFFASQAVLPGMRAAGDGAIVIMSSIAYMIGNAGYPAYVAANAGLSGLTRALAREAGPDGIRVNALAPGWTLTDRQMRLWADPESLAAHLDRQCLKRHLVPDDIVEPALFLASSASRMVSGQTLVVDGGVAATG